MMRLTLDDGTTHVVKTSLTHPTTYEKLDGDWIEKDSPRIVRVETGKMIFVPDIVLKENDHECV